MPTETARRGYFDPLVLAKIATMSLRARHVVEGLLSGLHDSPYRGYSVEFAEHREYVPGDEIRHIDWKAYGKFDRYFIKEYEEETNLRAYLLVDASALLNRELGSKTYFRIAGQEVKIYTDCTKEILGKTFGSFKVVGHTDV